MTPSHPLIHALAGVSFSPGTAAKRFVRDIASAKPDYELSEKQEAFAWRIAWHYRRQLPQPLRDEVIARKRDHQAEPEGDSSWRCKVCGRLLWVRDLKAPCSGPAEPKLNKAKPVKLSRPAEAVQVAEAAEDVLPLFAGR